MLDGAMLDQCIAEILGNYHGIGIMLNTLGDRIVHLLRTQGRADRGREYDQSELTDMLNGKLKAPDGKYYRVPTNRSTINRIISGKTKPTLELLSAICDMFGVDMEWLARGRSLDDAPADHFMTEEANTIGALVDKLPIELRTVLLDGAQLLYKLHTDQRKKEEELISLLEDNINLMGNGHRRIAREYIDRNRRHIDASEHSAREDR
jgi:transcriptional regulator with XRE-family HTH domain